MKSAVYNGIKKIDIEEVSKPVNEKNTALVRVKKTGICGTDLKTFRRGHPMFQPPCVLGHEFVGIIEEAGADIDDSYVGKKYVIAPYLECGDCETCKRGMPQFCSNKVWIDGALSEYVKIPKEILLRGTVEVPENMDEAIATLAEPLACAVHGVEKARISENDKILIVGAGSMGLLISIYLKNQNCKVTVSEVDSNRIALAESLGVNVINPLEKSVTEVIKEKGKFNSIILANDKGSLVPELLQCIENGGTLELFGGMPKDMRLEIDPYFVHYKEIDVVGTFGFAESHFKKAAEMIFSDPDSFAKLITKEFNMTEIIEAFNAAGDTKNIKVIVKI